VRQTKKIKPLSECSIGDCFIITELNIQGQLRRRLLDLGFVKGAEISVVQKSPLGNPIAYRVSSTTIALRKDESSKIYGKIMGGIKGEGI